MLISKQILLEEVLVNSNSFKSYFPELYKQIDKCIEKPKCGVCSNQFIKDMLLIEDHLVKLSKIFDEPNLILADDIITLKFNSDTKKALKTKTKVEVFFISLHLYKDFIEKFCENKLIRSISPILINKEEEDNIMVTIHWSTYAN